jgi:non-heme chloroperoxidase
MVGMFALMALAMGSLMAQQPGTAKPVDTSPHTVQFIEVEPGVKLEVLDWGGTGRPLILLAGLGNDAHIFDQFAPKLTAKYHVYGISRRGFGLSSAPVPTPTDDNYSADRLGDDVLAVSDALKLNRPVLVGHSIAGEELSSIGTRHPEKVAGLVYLDAGYGYAFYDSAHGDANMDLVHLERELQQLMSPGAPRERKLLVHELIETDLPQVGKDLQSVEKRLQAVPDSAPAPPNTPQTQATFAIAKGMERFGGIKCPVLAIFADPHDMSGQFKGDPTGKAAAEAEDRVSTSAQTDAFQAGNPTARVVRLANADHYVFKSNEADVLGEMNAFLATLPN